MATPAEPLPCAKVCDAKRVGGRSEDDASEPIMARVSRTTYEKREIRDMLSQSSEVHFDPSMESLQCHIA
jgi:hypothetical protein